MHPAWHLSTTGWLVPGLMESDGVRSGCAGHCAMMRLPRRLTVLPAWWSAFSIVVIGSVIVDSQVLDMGGVANADRC